MSRRMVGAIGLVAVMVVAGVAMTPVTLVTVTGEAGETIVCERVDQESSISLIFTHSMYGGEVTETFQPVSPSALLRTSILTDNAAAAEYYAWDGQVRPSGERFEVIMPDQEFSSLPIQVDQIGDHRLTIDDTILDMAAMVDDSEGVRLSLTTRPLVTQVIGAPC